MDIEGGSPSCVQQSVPTKSQLAWRDDLYFASASPYGPIIRFKEDIPMTYMMKLTFTCLCIKFSAANLHVCARFGVFEQTQKTLRAGG